MASLSLDAQGVDADAVRERVQQVRDGEDGTGIAIRHATAADVADMRLVFEQVASEGIYLGAEPPFTDADRVQWAKSVEGYISSEASLCLVACRTTEVVGVLYLKPTYPTQIQRLNLGMYVARDARGQGVGTRLVAEAVEWSKKRAEAKKLYKLYLEVWPWNHGAIKLYSRFGFVKEGYHPRQWSRKSGEQWDSMSMGLLLVGHDGEGGPSGPKGWRRGEDGTWHNSEV